MDNNIREELFEIMEDYNKSYKESRIVYINKATWTNWITKGKQTVNDIFILGYDNSDRPKIINQIVYKDKKYVIHEYITHINVNSYKETTEGLIGKYKIIFESQSFCNPITGHHVVNTNDIDKMLQGQLMFQNNNSPYQTAAHVVNSGIDFCLKRVNNSYLKAKHSNIELLTKADEYSIRNGSVDFSDIANIKPDEIFVKFKEADRYKKIKSSDYEQLKHTISDYYRVISYDDTIKALEDLPKTEVDFTVIGLGSAGTGILDQVARSNYFQNYLLIDFDCIETKNLRNQWYEARDLGYRKSEVSRKKVMGCNAGHPNVLTQTTKFQTVPLRQYTTKYVVSGFDNLECRLELLDKTLDDFDAQYLIDLRYLDYSCSIYFIDLTDEKQVKYYRSLLEADKKAFDEQVKYIETKEELMEYWQKKGLFNSGCANKRASLNMDTECCHLCGCRDCRDGLWESYQNAGVKIVKIENEESSCVKENFIDIYKFASSFVFSAIREIESGKEKPFTHIEAQSEVIPTSILIRK